MAFEARELMALERGDIITFTSGAKTLTAVVIARPTQDAMRKPGIGRIVIEARREMRALTRAQEELPFNSRRGVHDVRGDKVLSITKKAK